MSVDTPSSLPPWAISALIWICIGLTTISGGTGGWLFKKVWRKVEELEKASAHFATKSEVAQVALQIAPMVSRAELLAHLEQMRDDNAARDRRMQEDRERMHRENQAAINGVREDVKEARSDVRAIHQRIDVLNTK